MDKEQRLKELTEEERMVTQEKGTEAPFRNKYWDFKGDGMYQCKVCGVPLFKSDAKFDTTIPGLAGWPSFSEALPGAIRFEEDNSAGMHRTEIVCTNCGSHLGHIFDDRESVTGKHYCLNSCSLDFKQE
jgi:peptide-methionine (R)-S-oxide reductase